MAQENISAQLNDLLASRDFQAELLDKEGRPTDAENADIFTFDYVSSGGKNYGTMVIILDADNEMQVFYGDNLGRSMEGDDKTEFFDFVQHLHKFANMRRWTYSPKNINQVKYTMQGLAAIKEGLFEGYYGTRKVSYSGEPTEARLVIQHNRALGEADARFRYVESLFIETADAERFRLQFKNLAGGRAMLEHVRQGGKPYDVRGCHITEMVAEIATLSRFNRASAGRVLEGVTAELVTEAQQYYKSLRENLKRMAGTRGYQAYFESWHPAETALQEELVDSIKTMFVEQTLDSRIEAALPVLARLQQESKMKEADIFESWAERLSEGTWALPDTPETQSQLQDLMSRPLIVGPDATNATEQLYDLVGDDVLFDRLGELADRDASINIWDDSEVQARLAELGIQTPARGEPVAKPAADETPVQESRVKELSMDLEDPLMSDEEFETKYGDSRENMQRRSGRVQDRKTGKWYDPDEQFAQLRNSPDFQSQMRRMAQQESVEEDQLDEISADPAYLRAAERSRSQAQATQRTFGRSPEEKAAARRTELKRDKGIGGYTKRHRAANPEMYPTPRAQPAPKLRDPSTEYSDDYSTWAAGRRDTLERGIVENLLAEYETELNNSDVSEDAVADFLARGGEIQQGRFHKPRKSEKTDYGSRHIGGVRDAVAGKAGKTLGRAAATNFKGGGKAVVGEGASDYVGNAIEDLRMYKPGLDRETFLDELYTYLDAQYSKRAADAAMDHGNDAEYDEYYANYSDLAEQGVAEGSNDTVYPNAEVIKSKNGKPVGEIYQDGNSWGAFHYRADRGYDMIDSREDAIEALKDLHQETVRSRPDYTIKGVAEAEKNPHTSALGKALYRDLSKEKKASPAQVQRNKERWAKRQAEREQGVAEGSKDSAPKMGSKEKKLAQGALKGARDMTAALGLVRGKDGVARPPETKKKGVAEAQPEPEQQQIDANRRAALRREREPAGSDAIDARLAQQHAQRQEYEKTGKFWIKRKDNQQHISDVIVGKAAANAAALDMLKQQPELRGNIVITAYGPGESQNVKEEVRLPYPEGSENLGRANMELLIRAYNEPTSSRIRLNFGNKSVELDREDIAAIAEYYDDKLPSNEARWNFIRAVMNNHDNFNQVLHQIGRRSATNVRQPGLFQEADKKKDNDDLGAVKDVGLQRAISRAKADFPTAGSGIEALAKDFMRSQDQDRQDFERLQSAERKQDQLLSQISKVDREQEQEINNLETQNSAMSQRLQQLQNVNAELEKKLSAMTGRKEKRQAAKTTSPAAAGSAVSVPTVVAPKPAAKPRIKKQAAPKSKAIKIKPSAAMGNIATQLAPQAQAQLPAPDQGDVLPPMFRSKPNPELQRGKDTAVDAQYRDMPAAFATSENKQNKPEVDYDDPRWDAMVSRVGKLAKSGPLKTVWDPVKRVYKNVPANNNKEPVKEQEPGNHAGFESIKSVSEWAEKVRVMRELQKDMVLMSDSQARAAVQQQLRELLAHGIQQGYVK